MPSVQRETAEATQAEPLPASPQKEPAVAVPQEKPDNANTSLLDHKALLQLYNLTGEDLDFLAQMIDSYLTTSPDLMEKLNKALAENDPSGARLASHTLKSGSADMGAHQLQRLFSAVEAQTKEPISTRRPRRT